MNSGIPNSLKLYVSECAKVGDIPEPIADREASCRPCRVNAASIAAVIASNNSAGHPHPRREAP
jgi:hypothetical protein